MKHALVTAAGVFGAWVASGYVVKVVLGPEQQQSAQSAYVELALRVACITGGVLVAHRVEGRR